MTKTCLLILADKISV